MFNSWLPESNDNLPLTWWKQTPVYLAGIIAIAGAVSMVVFAIFGPEIMFGKLVFSVDAAFKQWQLWTPFTYLWVNPPSVWTLFTCYLLWRFGESVERHLGRRSFVKLLLILLLVPPLFITLVHFAGVSGMMAIGIMDLEFGVFIAFATLYPRACINIILLTLDAWVLATIFVTISALSSIANRDWGSLTLLLANVGSAYAFIRHQKGDFTLPSLPKVAILKDDEPVGKPKPKKPKKNKAKSPSSNVDDILDKISQHGMQSLTDEERRILKEAGGKS